MSCQNTTRIEYRPEWPPSCRYVVIVFYGGVAHVHRAYPSYLSAHRSMGTSLTDDHLTPEEYEAEFGIKS